MTAAKSDAWVELVSVLGGPTQVRDLGLAYYNLAMEREKPARAQAEQLLTVAARVMRVMRRCWDHWGFWRRWMDQARGQRGSTGRR